MEPYSSDSVRRKKRRKIPIDLDQNPYIEGVAIVSGDGLPIASALPRDMDEIFVSAMSAVILNMSKGAVKELGRGDLKRILIVGSSGTIILSKATEDAILCTLVKSEASLGIIFWNIENFSEKIARLLD